jgi:hypothetical protein
MEAAASDNRCPTQAWQYGFSVNSTGSPLDSLPQYGQWCNLSNMVASAFLLRDIRESANYLAHWICATLYTIIRRYW